MADISVMNVGGTDYNIKDSTSRTNSTKAMSLSAYYETGNTASQAYSIVGTPINWKGTLYYTKTTVAKGATWAVGTNLTAATNLGKLVRNIKTYVGSDSKLHFVDLTGADTALNFSAGDSQLEISSIKSTDRAFQRNPSITIPVNTDLSTLHDGIINSVWSTTNTNEVWTTSVQNTWINFVVTFSKTVKAIKSIIVDNLDGGLGINSPSGFGMYINGTWYDIICTKPYANLFPTYGPCLGKDGLTLNSNTLNLRMYCTYEHFGLSEIMFYGTYA
jgi:hypothetical protein